MTSGPIVVSVLEGENAVQRHRDLLGAPTRQTRWQVPALTTLTASPRTAPTVPTLLNPLLAKSRSSLLKARFARALANLVVFSTVAALAARVHPGHIVIYAPGDLKTPASPPTAGKFVRRFVACRLATIEKP
jgi:hypothetical protein